MRETLLIVDDFLDNATGLREAALRLTYPPQPDVNSVEPINIEGLDRQLSWLVNEHLAPLPTPSHGRVRLALDGAAAETRVRSEDGDWSGLLFLSRPDENRPGINFYRHGPTGTDGATPGAPAISSADPADWEQAMTIPVRFNRLVLFRSWLWHAPGPAFGDRLENGRLDYQVTFRSLRD